MDLDITIDGVKILTKSNVIDTLLLKFWESFQADMNKKVFL